MPPLDRGHGRSRLGAVACLFLLGGGSVMWLGSSGTASKEANDASEMPLYAAGVLVSFLLFLLLRAHVQQRQQHPHPQQQQHSSHPSTSTNCSLVGDCFARSSAHAHTHTTTPPNNPASNNASSSSSSSSSFGTRLRQFLAGRPLTLEEQHRRALALARAGVRTGNANGGAGGGDAAMEVLELMSREFNPGDYEVLSRLDETVDTSHRFGATATELALLPLHTVGKEEAAAYGELGKGGSSASSRREGSPTCSICLEKWEAGDVVRTLPCLHLFHAACLDPWLKKRFQCPNCNTWF